MGLEEDIKKFALANAYEHNGKANEKAVLGKLLGEDPNLRSKITSIMFAIQSIVRNINAMPQEAQIETLKKVWPEFFKPREKIIEKKDARDLPGAITNQVILRAAPNPNGPLHIGHARVVALNKLYQDKYKGKFILRFDDTDPKVKVPMKEAYDWIKDDVEWLGANIWKISHASSRLNRYYEVATELVNKNYAYVCTCNAEIWRDLAKNKKACPCRNLELKEQKNRWQKMLDSNKGKGYKEGEAVLRLKTDIQHNNPAMRDFPLMRIVDKPKHPFSNNHLWPLLNFAGPVDDHDLGVTHIIRGKDLDMVANRAEFLYRYMNWTHPYTQTMGILKFEDLQLSASKMRAAIEEKKYAGWDDVRLPTLKALRRRGFLPEAIIEFYKELGLKKADITVSIHNLDAINRKMLDPISPRFAFVPNPKKIKIEKAPAIKELKVKIHPEKPETRTIKLNTEFYIDKDDFTKLGGKEVRLKDLYNIKLGKKVSFTSKEVRGGIAKIQWVQAPGAIKTEVLMPNGAIVKGLVEKDASKLKVGDCVQFERFGFCRLDKKSKTNMVFAYTHS